jgi:cytochrome P450
MITWTLADIFIAGSETTAVTLRWIFLFMIHNPDVQKKVQEELDMVVGKDRYPAWEDKKNMPYTEAAILEVLRLTPPLPVGIERFARTDITVGGFRVPKVSSLGSLCEKVIIPWMHDFSQI